MKKYIGKFLGTKLIKEGNNYNSLKEKKTVCRKKRKNRKQLRRFNVECQKLSPDYAGKKRNWRQTQKRHVTSEKN